MGERIKYLWRVDPALVIMIWISRYVTALALATTIYLALYLWGLWAFVPVLLALHIATWIAWRED